MIAVIGVIVSILIQGIVSGWMDVLSIYICPLGAGLAGIMLFWVCGKEYVEKQVNKGRSSSHYLLVLPDLQICLCAGVYPGTGSWNRAGRYRMKKYFLTATLFLSEKKQLQ